MTLVKSVNGVLVELTPAETQEYNDRTAVWEAQANQRLFDDCQSRLEILINEKAAEKNYSSGVSCASYKDSTNVQWAAEATAFIAWRDNCYEYGYDYMAKAQDGIILSPSVDDFISGLPVMEWPTTQEG